MKNWAHSTDLRERAVGALAGGMHVDEVARLFRVSRRSVYRWRAQMLESGTLEAKAHRSGNKPRVDAQGEAVVLAILDERPDVTLREATIYFIERTDKPCSRSSMGRAMARMRITRKKSP